MLSDKIVNAFTQAFRQANYGGFNLERRASHGPGLNGLIGSATTTGITDIAYCKQRDFEYKRYRLLSNVERQMFDRDTIRFSTSLSRREALAASLGSAAAGARVRPASGRTAEHMTLIRSKDGRRLSGFRYRNAEAFFMGIEHRQYGGTHDLFYRAGIVAQLALSSHLLDVGFDDRWCARNLGLDVGAALACANATGLGHSSSEFAKLAVIISPYNQWRNPDLAGVRTSLPTNLPEVGVVLRALLDHVRNVTGHRPVKRRNGG